MKKTMAINTQFLDKLEELFINNSNIVYVIIKGETPEEKDNIYFSAGYINDLEDKEIYVKEFINYLKNPHIKSKYNFYLFVSRTTSDNISIQDYLISLSPSDQDLLFIYSKIDFMQNDSLAFLELFKEKNNLIQALKLGNNNIIDQTNYFKFLEECFNTLRNFKFSSEEYYDIFFNCLQSSKIVYDKQHLSELITKRIHSPQLVESLHTQLFNDTISVDTSIDSKSVQKIELTSSNLMRKYKFISSDDIDNLLCFFVECVTNYIDKLSSTSRIQYFKEKINISNITEYNLIIETNNIEECKNLLDLYLSYFVDFNEQSDIFISNIKQKNYIFENLIVCQKNQY